LTPLRCRTVVLCGISASFPALSPCQGQIVHVLLTRPPLGNIATTSSDLHGSGTPPAFVLSQDQTLLFKSLAQIPLGTRFYSKKSRSLSLSSLFFSVLCGFQGARVDSQNRCIRPEGLAALTRRVDAMPLGGFPRQQQLAYSIKPVARCQAQFRDFPHKTPVFQLPVKAAFASFDCSQYFIVFYRVMQAVTSSIFVCIRLARPVVLHMLQQFIIYFKRNNSTYMSLRFQYMRLVVPCGHCSPMQPGLRVISESYSAAPILYINIMKLDKLRG